MPFLLMRCCSKDLNEIINEGINEVLHEGLNEIVYESLNGRGIKVYFVSN
ncbi:MAG: hypothetical protein Hyperionvirus3_45 [Hyperionvirus sp.]|uniref:Uncharacterized protein n=1 Tax=Hyperionvirus sp. TaxID=2487770 RepID=A0A3G5AC63_9VIRU|nr:MAG: hypothetical protein Hyperionvirus3_45 [Hyperionvirus sp.]